jgi:hypothetical protein
LDNQEAGGIVLGGWGDFVVAGGAGGGEFEEFGDRTINSGGNLRDLAAEEAHFSGVVKVLSGVKQQPLIGVIRGGVLRLGGFNDDDGEESTVGVEFIEYAEFIVCVLNDQAINVCFVLCDEVEQFGVLIKKMAGVAIAP